MPTRALSEIHEVIFNKPEGVAQGFKSMPTRALSEIHKVIFNKPEGVALSLLSVFPVKARVGVL